MPLKSLLQFTTLMIL